MDQPEPVEEPLGQDKKPQKTVYLFNMSEDVWPFISSISDTAARYFEIEENANLADRELFSIADKEDAIFISPKPIDPGFLDYYQNLFNIKKIRVLTPAKHTGPLSTDILNDSNLIDELIKAANSVKRLTMIPYSTTHEFLELVEHLRSRGLTVVTPESPEYDSVWAVNFYGSKSGIRQLADQSQAIEPDLKVPDGMICSDILDASMVAAHKYVKESGVVIKTNKGHSGAGVLIFREGDLPSEYHACQQAIYKVFKKDQYWDLFSIVIEDLVNVNFAVGGGFPNVEFKINKSGQINLLYMCGLRVTKDGVFLGIEINEDIMNDRLATRLVDTGFYIGERYAAAGYRGYFDVDFIAAKNGELYVTESNVRRTGGTFVYKTVQNLIGKDFMADAYTLSNNIDLPAHLSNSFEAVRHLLEPILYNPKTKEGLVIASANLLNQKKFLYIIIGQTKKSALAIEQQMMELLSIPKKEG